MKGQNIHETKQPEGIYIKHFVYISMHQQW